VSLSYLWLYRFFHGEVCPPYSFLQCFGAAPPDDWQPWPEPTPAELAVKAMVFERHPDWVQGLQARERGAREHHERGRCVGDTRGPLGWPS
jgi:hypothetical protein